MKVMLCQESDRKAAAISQLFGGYNGMLFLTFQFIIHVEPPIRPVVTF
jgi:hypothetical protein